MRSSGCENPFEEQLGLQTSLFVCGGGAYFSSGTLLPIQIRNHMVTFATCSGGAASRLLHGLCQPEYFDIAFAEWGC